MKASSSVEPWCLHIHKKVCMSVFIPIISQCLLCISRDLKTRLKKKEKKFEFSIISMMMVKVSIYLSVYRWMMARSFLLCYIIFCAIILEFLDCMKMLPIFVCWSSPNFFKKMKFGCLDAWMPASCHISIECCFMLVCLCVIFF